MKKQLALLCLGVSMAQVSLAQTWDNSQISTTTTGAVGIGTSNPQKSLDVVGDAQLRGLLQFSVNPSATNPLLLKSFDNITMQTQLEISHIGDVVNYANKKGALSFYSEDGSTFMYSRQKFDFYTKETSEGSYTQKFTILNNGNVGVGVGAPLFKLDVASSARIMDGLYIDRNGSDGFIQFQKDASNIGQLRGYGSSRVGFTNNSSSTTWPFMVDFANNRIGVNTNSPTTALDVNGGINAQNIILSSGLYVRANGEDKFKVQSNGTVWCTELNIRATPFPDYVFEDAYHLTTIDSLETYIEKNNHLPNMPSAAQVEEKGIGVGELQLKMVEKIEELSLYIIDLNSRIKQLEVENQKLKQEGK